MTQPSPRETCAPSDNAVGPSVSSVISDESRYNTLIDALAAVKLAQSLAQESEFWDHALEALNKLRRSLIGIAAKNVDVLDHVQSRIEIFETLEFIVKCSAKKSQAGRIVECLKILLPRPIWIHTATSKDVLRDNLMRFLRTQPKTNDLQDLIKCPPTLLQDADAELPLPVSNSGAGDKLGIARESLLDGCHRMQHLKWTFPVNGTDSASDDGMVAFVGFYKGVEQLDSFASGRTSKCAEVAAMLKEFDSHWAHIIKFMTSVVDSRPSQGQRASFIMSKLSRMSKEFCLAREGSQANTSRLGRSALGTNNDARAVLEAPEVAQDAKTELIVSKKNIDGNAEARVLVKAVEGMNRAALEPVGSEINIQENNDARTLVGGSETVEDAGLELIVSKKHIDAHTDAHALMKAVEGTQDAGPESTSSEANTDKNNDARAFVEGSKAAEDVRLELIVSKKNVEAHSNARVLAKAVDGTEDAQMELDFSKKKKKKKADANNHAHVLMNTSEVADEVGRDPIVSLTNLDVTSALPNAPTGSQQGYVQSPRPSESSGPCISSDLRELYGRMREAVVPRDRTWMAMSYRAVIDAKDIIDWLCTAEGVSSRSQAVLIGRALQKEKYIVHVWGSHTRIMPFSDATMFFRCPQDGDVSRSPSRRPNDEET